MQVSDEIMAIICPKCSEGYHFNGRNHKDTEYFKIHGKSLLFTKTKNLCMLMIDNRSMGPDHPFLTFVPIKF